MEIGERSEDPGVGRRRKQLNMKVFAVRYTVRQFLLTKKSGSKEVIYG